MRSLATYRRTSVSAAVVFVTAGLALAQSGAYTFDDAQAKDRHLTQYFEIFGNRAVYHDGWLAGTVHKAPWETKPRHPLLEDVWEPYDVRSDFKLFVNGQEMAEGRIERTQPLVFSADETADVGIDLGTPVVEAIGCEERSRFTGRIPKVTIEVRDVNAKADAAVAEALKEVARRTE